MDFSVFIAESLSAEDFYEDRTDGFAANEILKIQQVRTSYKIAFDKIHLSRAVDEARGGGFEVFHFQLMVTIGA